MEGIPGAGAHHPQPGAGDAGRDRAPRPRLAGHRGRRRRPRGRARRPRRAAGLRRHRSRAHRGLPRLCLDAHAIGRVRRRGHPLRRIHAAGLEDAAARRDRPRPDRGRTGRRLSGPGAPRRPGRTLARRARRHLPATGGAAHRRRPRSVPRRCGAPGRDIQRRPPAPRTGRRLASGNPRPRRRGAVRADRAGACAGGDGHPRAHGPGLDGGLGRIQQRLRAQGVHGGLCRRGRRPRHAARSRRARRVRTYPGGRRGIRRQPARTPGMVPSPASQLGRTLRAVSRVPYRHRAALRRDRRRPRLSGRCRSPAPGPRPRPGRVRPPSRCIWPRPRA